MVVKTHHGKGGSAETTSGKSIQKQAWIDLDETVDLDPQQLLAWELEQEKWAEMSDADILESPKWPSGSANKKRYPKSKHSNRHSGASERQLPETQSQYSYGASRHALSPTDSLQYTRSGSFYLEDQRHVQHPPSPGFSVSSAKSSSSKTRTTFSVPPTLRPNASMMSWQSETDLGYVTEISANRDRHHVGIKKTFSNSRYSESFDTYDRELMPRMRSYSPSAVVPRSLSMTGHYQHPSPSRSNQGDQTPKNRLPGIIAASSWTSQLSRDVEADELEAEFARLESSRGRSYDIPLLEERDEQDDVYSLHSGHKAGYDLEELEREYERLERRNKEIVILEDIEETPDDGIIHLEHHSSVDYEEEKQKAKSVQHRKAVDEFDEKYVRGIGQEKNERKNEADSIEKESEGDKPEVAPIDKQTKQGANAKKSRLQEKLQRLEGDESGEMHGTDVSKYPRLQEIRQRRRERLKALQAIRQERAEIWSTLEANWEQMEDSMARRLGGRLPKGESPESESSQSEEDQERSNEEYEGEQDEEPIIESAQQNEMTGLADIPETTEGSSEGTDFNEENEMREIAEAMGDSEDVEQVDPAGLAHMDEIAEVIDDVIKEEDAPGEKDSLRFSGSDSNAREANSPRGEDENEDDEEYDTRVYTENLESGKPTQTMDHSGTPVADKTGPEIKETLPGSPSNTESSERLTANGKEVIPASTVSMLEHISGAFGRHDDDDEDEGRTRKEDPPSTFGLFITESLSDAGSKVVRILTSGRSLEEKQPHEVACDRSDTAEDETVTQTDEGRYDDDVSVVAAEAGVRFEYDTEAEHQGCMNPLQTFMSRQRRIVVDESQGCMNPLAHFAFGSGEPMPCNPIKSVARNRRQRPRQQNHLYSDALPSNSSDNQEDVEHHDDHGDHQDELYLNQSGDDQRFRSPTLEYSNSNLDEHEQLQAGGGKSDGYDNEMEDEQDDGDDNEDDDDGNDEQLNMNIHQRGDVHDGLNPLSASTSKIMSKMSKGKSSKQSKSKKRMMKTKNQKNKATNNGGAPVDKFFTLVDDLLVNNILNTFDEKVVDNMAHTFGFDS